MLLNPHGIDISIAGRTVENVTAVFVNFESFVVRENGERPGHQFLMNLSPQDEACCFNLYGSERIWKQQDQNLRKMLLEC